MRIITDHAKNDLNNKIALHVIDEPGAGGANHHYEIIVNGDTGPRQTHIHFQEGPIREKGVNGISNEVLMTIVIDRLRGFQSGQFSCRENSLALTKLEESLLWLQKRTSDRYARGVEGTNQI